MENMTRSELARKCGVHIETLRYYETKKLMDSPKRSESGYRLYTLADAVKIRFIKNAQKLGFTLNDISDLLQLRIYKEKSCDKAMVKAQEKLEDIENKIKTLNIIKMALKELIKQCEESTPTTGCPILSKFETKNIL
ncbi:MAG: MerR family transcriptional regulator [Nitrospina sp.]|nr:MAG: MerR family transcriptional regulator [Nitrospina sp.]